MVEEVSEQSQQGKYIEVVSLNHFPKTGGVKKLSVVKADNGWFLRIESFDKKNPKNNSRAVFSLAEDELALLAVKLFKEAIGGV